MTTYRGALAAAAMHEVGVRPPLEVEQRDDFVPQFEHVLEQTLGKWASGAVGPDRPDSLGQEFT